MTILNLHPTTWPRAIPRSGLIILGWLMYLLVVVPVGALTGMSSEIIAAAAALPLALTLWLRSRS